MRMSEFFLIPVMLAMFFFGYFIIKKFNSFIDENQRQIEAEKRKRKNKIRIAAENRKILEYARPMLDNYSAADPWVEFFIKSGSSGRLLEELSEGKIDIVLLSEEHAANPDTRFSVIEISSCDCDEKLKEKSSVCALWKRDVKSINRDRVIFALGNGLR